MSQQPSSKSTDTAKVTTAPAATKRPVHYTLILRLPFPRGDFADPDPVNWDISKDRKLWKLISRSGAKGVGQAAAQDRSGLQIGSSSSTGSADIDWEARAAEFGVDTKFLITQAAWLYERHLEAVKKQLGRLKTGYMASSPHAALTTAQSKKSVSSGAPSALSIRSSHSPVLKLDVSAATTPIAQPDSLSRTPSYATITQSKQLTLPTPTSPCLRSLPKLIRKRPSGLAAARSPRELADDSPDQASDAASDAASESSDSTSSDDTPQMSKSQAAFRRPARFGARRQAPPIKSKGKIETAMTGNGDGGDDDNNKDDDDDADDDDDDDEGESDGRTTFLSFAAEGPVSEPSKDLSATLRGATARGKQPATHVTTEPSQTPTNAALPSLRNRPTTRHEPSQTAECVSLAVPFESSNSSLSSATNTISTNPSHKWPSLSSPHIANLARLSSPRRRGGEISDGTPSMGSSFSDLDDASFTQSALEEAYASNIRTAGGSRLSNIGHAFRSRLGQ